jgi:ribokinase
MRAAGTIAGAFDAIVTLGGEGCVVATRHGERRHLAADKVAIVSSHGAGDAYCGTIAAAIARGADHFAAAQEASTAAARLVAQVAE